MKCEICGGDVVGRPYQVVVDGVKLLVCRRCAERLRGPKREVPLRRLTAAPRRLPRRAPPRMPGAEYEVVEDFAERVREAREAMGLTRELLARMVGEKESTIRRIEDGTLIPSLDLARKLERALRVVLVVESSSAEELGEGYKGGGYELTLGDVARIRRRK